MASNQCALQWDKHFACQSAAQRETARTTLLFWSGQVLQHQLSSGVHRLLGRLARRGVAVARVLNGISSELGPHIVTSNYPSNAAATTTAGGDTAKKEDGGDKTTTIEGDGYKVKVSMEDGYDIEAKVADDY